MVHEPGEDSNFARLSIFRRARMGHTDEEMTQKYTHVIEEDARQVAAEFDRYLRPTVNT
jgi:integrase